MARRRVGPEQWITAATEALIRGGLDQVKVEALARGLGVTKGSFYWHFKDRRALLDALLAQWQAEGTDAVMARVEPGGGTAEARLRRLWAEAVGDHAGDRTELAIREMAHRDEAALTAVRAVDAARMTYLVGLLTRMGHPPAQAQVRALTIYALMVGEAFFRLPYASPEARQAAFQAAFEAALA